MLTIHSACLLCIYEQFKFNLSKNHLLNSNIYYNNIENSFCTLSPDFWWALYLMGKKELKYIGMDKRIKKMKLTLSFTVDYHLLSLFTLT